MRPACLTSEKPQKKQRSRTVQLFAVLCGFSYATERLFLVILAVFLLIGGLAGKENTGPFPSWRPDFISEGIFIHQVQLRTPANKSFYWKSTLSSPAPLSGINDFPDRALDGLEEARLKDKKYGSTLRGIAPVYSDKYQKKTIMRIFAAKW